MQITSDIGSPVFALGSHPPGPIDTTAEASDFDDKLSTVGSLL